MSETLRQLMDKVSQTESHIRESHRTLQSGETVLDEVRSSLDRIAELAAKAAGSRTGRLCKKRWSICGTRLSG